jgi:hypothetical protein
MRTSSIVTSYVQAGLFLLLGLNCIRSWLRTRDVRSGHLALATGLFGVNSLMSAITGSLYDTTKGQQAPRWEGIVSSIVIYLAILAFLWFLSDFIRFPVGLKAVAVVSVAVNCVLAILIKPGVSFKGGRLEITYRPYVLYILLYIAVTLAVLGLSFLFYGTRVRGLARVRMLSIGAGFTILFVVVGVARICRSRHGAPALHRLRAAPRAHTAFGRGRGRSGTRSVTG